jgi:glycosyltransferase involved in cell wall biosynthesis
LHYRVPVYKELNEMLNGEFTLIYSIDRTAESVRNKVSIFLKDNAIGLSQEFAIKLGIDKDNFANRGYNIPLQPGLLKTIFNSKPDIIISEGFFQWTPASLVIKLIKKIPLVIAYERTVHTERNAGALRTFYRRMLVKQTDAICCNGVLSKEYCTNVLGMPPERIVTGAMAADTDSLAAHCMSLSVTDIHALEKRMGLARPVFLYVGRLVRLKGLRELLRGWELYVKESLLNYGTLLLVGEGPERLVLEDIVNKKKLPNIIFAGAIDYDNIAPCYAVSDIFVIPTLEDNWSLVVPEAMSCGKPILCSKYNGCWPELVHQDVNGWIFDPFSPDEIAAKLKACTSYRDRLPQMGNASRKIVQEYSPHRAAEAILKACYIALDHRRTK